MVGPILIEEKRISLVLYRNNHFFLSINSLYILEEILKYEGQ
jgi:hypothetical protein